MKATELMIGDWYKWYADGREYFFKVDRESFYLQDDTLANFEPIPLTAEILEKNGWKRDLDKEWKYNNSYILPHYCYQWEKRNVKIEMDKGLEGFTTSLIIGRRFYAVHELQHALRLCGLDDLANNLQV